MKMEIMTLESALLLERISLKNVCKNTTSTLYAALIKLLKMVMSFFHVASL